MAEIHGLFGDHPAVLSHGPPDPELIAVLEEMLDQARSGYLRAIASARIFQDRSIAHGWSGHADTHDMMAGIGILHHRYYAEDRES